MEYPKRYLIASDGTYTYVGRSEKGALESLPCWFITRIEEATGSITTSPKNSIWNNYATLIYS